VTQVEGAPDRPVEASVIRAKFAANAGRRFDAERVSRLEGAILGVSEAPDAGALARLL
jgi:hypothetical protein